ncbi:MAG TPA: OB-fold nucleic acid binding domain-containing protein, partial [Patescibacteria group bacterium]|nr:OB-fold nucleic acid binding domain-containing protein [Patescibacteria group bacterium]
MINHPITALPGIGPKLSVNYRKLGIETVRDLLFAFPFRYEDYRTIRGIADLSPGETTTVQGSITSIRSRRSPRKKMTLTEATIEDATGTITAVWFHQPYIAKTLKVGDRVSLSGKIDDKFGLSIVNPQFETIKDSGPTK